MSELSLVMLSEVRAYPDSTSRSPYSLFVVSKIWYPRLRETIMDPTRIHATIYQELVPDGDNIISSITYYWLAPAGQFPGWLAIPLRLLIE